MGNNMNHKAKYIIIAGLGFISCFNAKAQTKENSGLTGVITEINDIKPKLADAVKIDVVQVQENIAVKKPEMTYTTESYLLPTPVYKSKMQPAFIKSAPLPELHKCFVEGAFGNYSNLYGEAFFNTVRNRTDLFSADLKHFSGDGPVKNSGFSDNLVDIYASHIFNAKYDLGGDVGYERTANRFYATLPDNLQPTNGSDSESFNDFHAKIHFANTGADTGKLRYSLGVGYDGFSNYYKTTESDITATLMADEPINTNDIVLNASYDYVNYKTESSINRSLLKIDAGYRFKTGIIRSYLGFKTATNSGDLNTSSFNFYPDLNIEADIVEKYLSIFGGITGDMQKNTLRQLAYENPFIVSAPELRNTNDLFELFGGLKGSFSSSSSFLVRAAYINYQNLFFYIEDTTDRRKFIPVYDNGTTRVINIHGELGWTFSENFDMNTKVDFNYYSVSNLAFGGTSLHIQKPFERPGFEWMLTGDYNIEHKIVFGGDLFFVASRSATDLSEKDITTLKPFIDLNAHVNYAFSNIPGFKVFVQLNNIFGNKYQVWENYPVRGFQIVGGASFSFL